MSNIYLIDTAAQYYFLSKLCNSGTNNVIDLQFSTKTCYNYLQQQPTTISFTVINILDEVDVVLNQSNTHRESSGTKQAKAKFKKKKRRKWSNSEIHKLIEEARTCL